MWDMLVRTPRGRISTRKYLSVATTFLVVCFAYIFATAPTTYAADAEWKGSDLIYQQHTYKKDEKPATGSETHGLPKDTVIYRYVESAGSGSGGATQKAYLIYFAPRSDPATATTATYRTYDLLGQTGYSNPSLPVDITLDPSSTTTSTTALEPTTSCAVDGVGWIVCSMSRWIAEGVDFLYDILAKFFIVQPLTAASPSNSMYSLWQTVRNIANVAFIIAFLIVIYSQITSNAMSNYTVKKMIPRIIVAAILVNTSYWLCAVAIDISNIMGVAVQDLFINLREGLGAANMADIPKWGDVTAVILSGTGIVIGGGALLAATSGAAGGLVFLLLGALLPAIFAALVAVAILAARQALITLFVIIAPLAFVAYLLPNTEEWFNRWRKLFMTALIMFPAFSLIFGAAQLTGVIIIQNANQDISIALLGLTVQVVPLFITPFLIKLSSGLLGTIAGIANDRSKGVFDRTKNWADSNRKLHRARGMRNGLTEGRRGNRFRPTTYGARAAMKSIDREARTKAYTGQAQALYDNNTRTGRRTALETNRATREGEISKHRNNERFERALAGDPTGEDARRLRVGPQWAQNTVNSALDHAVNNRQAARDAAQFGDLSHRLHEAHASEVNAGILHDNFHNQGEQHARDAIAAAAGQNSYLGRINTAQVNSIQAAGLAENSKNLVEAQGKLALKQTIEGDAHRTQQVVLTQQFTKEAEQYDTIVQKAAEAAYDNYSRTNQSAQELRLRSVVETDKARLAENQWNKIVEEARAQGYAATNVFDQNTLVAETIQTLHQEIETEGQAQNSEKLVQQSNLTTAFKADAQLRKRAAGSDRHGEVRVLAAAKKAVSEELIKATNNVYDTMDYDLASDPEELEIAWNDAARRGEMSEVIAYARKLSLNAPGLRKLKPLLEQFTDGKDPLADDVMLLKEVLAGDDGFRNAGRDMEVWANNEKNPDTGRIYTNFAEARNASGPYANITASRFARMNAYSQEETLWWLQENAPEKLDLLLQGIGDENSQVWRELKGSTREQITNSRAGRGVTDPNRPR